MRRTRLVPFLLLALLPLVTACAPRAIRGGPGTENPSIDEAALSVGLDRTDVQYLVDQNLSPLFNSKFWTDKVQTARKEPLVAIWPIQNATSQHIDDQLLQVLSHVETSLVNSGQVAVVDRARQAALAREIGIQQGEIYDPLAARRLGRQLGAEYFVTGKMTSVEEKLGKTKRIAYTLFLQIIEIETGLIRFQHEAERTKGLQG